MSAERNAIIMHLMDLYYIYYCQSSTQNVLEITVNICKYIANHTDSNQPQHRKLHVSNICGEQVHEQGRSQQIKRGSLLSRCG